MESIRDIPPISIENNLNRQQVEKGMIEKGMKRE